ncbi:MAG: M15 family metallopeptidase [Oscillospiraceae bacterium]|nr:M15 family metallopeptidase [Oscillospiraceae bacterium]
MKKLICLILSLCMLLSLSACNSANPPTTGGTEQTVSESYRRYGHVTKVTVDLSSGWTALFDEDGVRLYNGPSDDGRAPVARGSVISRPEYNRLVAEHSDNSTFSGKNDHAKYSEGPEGGIHSLFAVGNGAYYHIAVKYGAGAESIYPRFLVTPDEEAEAAVPEKGLDYLTLVNRLNPLPDWWEDHMTTTEFTNALGNTITVEKQAYAAYLRLKDALAQEGIDVVVSGAYRSADEQQELLADMVATYGAAYTADHAALPGYSEYQTGLALDLSLVVDGTIVTDSDELLACTELWSTIHAKLADYGFILRCPRFREHITGLRYAPWHIRYVGSVSDAQEIMSAGVSLEEYRGAVSGRDIPVDLGESVTFWPMELYDAAITTKYRFSTFTDCTLQSVRYAGDSFNTSENVAWLSELADAPLYQVVQFFTSFKTGTNPPEPLKPLTTYTDYPWWLGRTEGGEWILVTWG